MPWCANTGSTHQPSNNRNNVFMVMDGLRVACPVVLLSCVDCARAVCFSFVHLWGHLGWPWVKYFTLCSWYRGWKLLVMAVLDLSLAQLQILHPIELVHMRVINFRSQRYFRIPRCQGKMAKWPRSWSTQTKTGIPHPFTPRYASSVRLRMPADDTHADVPNLTWTYQLWAATVRNL